MTTGAAAGTYVYERYVWASGSLLITIDIRGESRNLDKALIDAILTKAGSDAAVLNKSKEDELSGFL